MIKYLINAISSALTFSKTEAKGSLVLIFITSIAITISYLTIQNAKNSEMVGTDQKDFDKWVSATKSAYSYKKNDNDLKFTKTQKLNRKQTDDQPKFSSRADKQIISDKKEAKKIKDLNLTTAKELQSIKGIGKAYSTRIIKFRNRLGGFSSLSQLDEVYGLTPELIAKIKSEYKILSNVQPMNLNHDSVKLLIQHPYISYDLAWVLINYRKQNGDIKGIEDLSKIKAIDDSLLHKLRPYIQ